MDLPGVVDLREAAGLRGAVLEAAAVAVDLREAAWDRVDLAVVAVEVDEAAPAGCSDQPAPGASTR